MHKACKGDAWGRGGLVSAEYRKQRQKMMKSAAQEHSPMNETWKGQKQAAVSCRDLFSINADHQPFVSTAEIQGLNQYWVRTAGVYGAMRPQLVAAAAGQPNPEAVCTAPSHGTKGSKYVSFFGSKARGSVNN
jgi:hypothetical protein